VGVNLIPTNGGLPREERAAPFKKIEAVKKPLEK
jgi:hypothetical protein